LILQTLPVEIASGSPDELVAERARITDCRIDAGDETVRARLVGLPAPMTPAAALILLDDMALDRLEAAARYWRALRSQPVPPDPRMTSQRRQRLRQMLRVVDARLERQTYRAIALTLFPKHRIDAASWAGDAIRETIIRLARDGMKLVRGGYRDLLKRPRKG
jgi:hypothetical protein